MIKTISCKRYSEDKCLDGVCTDTILTTTISCKRYSGVPTKQKRRNLRAIISARRKYGEDYKVNNYSTDD